MSLSGKLGDILGITRPVLSLSAVHDVQHVLTVREIMTIGGAAIVGTLHMYVKPFVTYHVMQPSTVSALRK